MVDVCHANNHRPGRPHRLPVQCALEAYSVLTRLPPPHRVAPLIVRAFLAANFEDLDVIPTYDLPPAATAGGNCPYMIVAEPTPPSITISTRLAAVAKSGNS